MSQMIKVGLFATLCLVVLGVLVWKIEGWNPFAAAAGRRLEAVFGSVAGLDDKAAVRVAGVRVGKVNGIGLAKDGRSALVRLLLDRPLHLTAGTRARIANMGLLGDKYVELVPGPPGGPELPDRAVVPGATPVTFDAALAKIDAISDSIQRITGSGATDLGANINRLAADLQLTSAEIRALVAENRANVASTVRNADQFSALLARELPRISDQMEHALDQIAAVVAENRPDVQQSLANIRDITTRLQTSVDNLNEITGQVAKGQGTIGKLVNSEEAYDRAVSTLDSIKSGVETLSGTIGAIQRFHFNLNLEGFQLQKSASGFSNSHSSFAVTIDPEKSDRFYKVGVASTPEGSLRITTQTITTTQPDGSVSVQTIDTRKREDRYILSALLGFKGPWDSRLAAGILEGRGGVQAEYPLFDRRAWLSLEAFDFSRQDRHSAHLRLSGRWFFHPNFYLVGGYDDFLVTKRLFLGGGARWTDDYIKYLLGGVSSRF